MTEHTAAFEIWTETLSLKLNQSYSDHFLVKNKQKKKPCEPVLSCAMLCYAGCLDTVEPAVRVDSLYLLVRW